MYWHAQSPCIGERESMDHVPESPSSPVLLVHARHPAEVTVLEDGVVAALQELEDHDAFSAVVRFFRFRLLAASSGLGGILKVRAEGLKPVILASKL